MIKIYLHELKIFKSELLITVSYNKKKKIIFTSVKETTEKDGYFTRSPTWVRKCSDYTNKPSAFYLKTQSVILPRPAAGIVVLCEFSQRHSIAFLLRYRYCSTMFEDSFSECIEHLRENDSWTVLKPFYLTSKFNEGNRLFLLIEV